MQTWIQGVGTKPSANALHKVSAQSMAAKAKHRENALTDAVNVYWACLVVKCTALKPAAVEG